MIYTVRDLKVGEHLLFVWNEGVFGKGCIKCVVTEIHLDYAIAKEVNEHDYKMTLRIEDFNISMFRRDRR